jgi:hypothetical protein
VRAARTDGGSSGCENMRSRWWPPSGISIERIESLKLVATPALDQPSYPPEEKMMFELRREEGEEVGRVGGAPPNTRAMASNTNACGVRVQLMRPLRFGILLGSRVTSQVAAPVLLADPLRAWLYAPRKLAMLVDQTLLPSTRSGNERGGIKGRAVGWPWIATGKRASGKSDYWEVELGG